MPNTIKIEFQGQSHDAVPVEANQSNEYWNQYLLEDGTVLKVKTVVTNIMRLIDEYAPDGDPVYVIKSGNVVTVTCPEGLKKK